MSKVIIEVEALSKLYRLGHIGTGTLSHDLNRWWHRIRGKDDPYLLTDEKNDRTSASSSGYAWSVRDINFSVNQGDVLGIIGRNGAGKSTLLRMLSKITRPTTGKIRLDGRIASLLEVGTGFHPDLSGRDNVFLNGAILGMTKVEIKKKFDEIVNFSGVEKYIDTPVKRYSSGMYVRLAFAVAAHLEPEILIVDEVLAVGDSEFQQKCLGKMKDVSTNQGRTVLFVSHSLPAIKQLCSRALLLDQGQQVAIGRTSEILELYQDAEKDPSAGERGKIPTTLPGYFTNWKLVGTNLPGLHSCYSRDKCKFSFGFLANDILKNCEINFRLTHGDLLVVNASNLADQGSSFQLSPGNYTFLFEMDFPIREAKLQVEVFLFSQGRLVDSWLSGTALTVLDRFDSPQYLGMLNEKVHFEIQTESSRQPMLQL